MCILSSSRDAAAVELGWIEEFLRTYGVLKNIFAQQYGRPCFVLKRCVCALSLHAHNRHHGLSREDPSGQLVSSWTQPAAARAIGRYLLWKALPYTASWAGVLPMHDFFPGDYIDQWELKAPTVIPTMAAQPCCLAGTVNMGGDKPGSADIAMHLHTILAPAALLKLPC
eukprot:1141821-Pelagomonas_calceolata.AAC.2